MSHEITLDATIDPSQSMLEVLRRTSCVLLRNALPRRPLLVAGRLCARTRGA